MSFEFTPEEARRPAKIMLQHFKRQHMRVRIEKPAWPEAPYRTTLVAEKSGRHILVEAQGTMSYERPLSDLAAWLSANRLYAEFYIVTTEHAVLQVSLLRAMKRDGVGLFVISDTGTITVEQRAKNPALVINPDPTLTYGSSKTEVIAAIQKFNEIDRKDGLRDMCEIVERNTAETGVKACRKRWLKIPETNFLAKDWFNQINELARNDAYNPPRQPLIDSILKDDMQSFRGARNLVDHAVRSRRADTKRQKQFAERMMQGPRLVSELVSIKRRIR